MPFRALLVDVDYGLDQRRGVVRAVLESTPDLDTGLLAEAAARELLLRSGPPRRDRHALVVEVPGPPVAPLAAPPTGMGSPGPRPGPGPPPGVPGPLGVPGADGADGPGPLQATDAGPGTVVAIVEFDAALVPRVLRPSDPGATGPAPPWEPAPGPPAAPGAEVRYGRRRHGYGLLAATGVLGALAAAGMLLGADDGFLPATLARVVAGAGLVLALACVVIAARHLLARGAALELDADGLVDRTRMAPGRRVRWAEVAAVEVSRPSRRHFAWIADRLPDTTYLVLRRTEGRPAVVALGPVRAAPRDVVSQVAVHWRGATSGRAGDGGSPS